ncbi:Y-family DNA polymerase [Neptuniibacter sp. SY11_33]|uniref:Y-family DNA polymerase n=1 Tax=Neptuniibacter sp. SY11_33 TaxID=3398215 RepID=UPI0039F4C96F
MYALIDASGMYASCEKIFDPTIRKRPVVVLSNNDGCIVATCPIAKKMGVPKFGPYFKIKDQLDRAGVVARSSNYELYADISSRMMELCASFAPEQHIYSIDECFLRFDHYIPPEGWHELGMKIRRKVWKEVRLPVGVGFGPTPTLAKAANHASKKLPGFSGVAVIDNDQIRKQILQQMEIRDVWGVGRRIGERLNLLGVKTAWQLAQTKPALMKKHFSILIANTAEELNGLTRVSWDDVRSPKKQIYSTRSFGQRITGLTDLKQALATHATIAAQKLRAQESATSNIIVFAHNSIHDKESFFKRSAFHQFATPTCDTAVIVKVTSQLAEQIYQAGIRYYKAGIGLLEISTATPYQPDIFTPSADQPELMKCLDQINSKYGRDTLHLARQGIQQNFKMKRELLSPRYTTRIEDIPIIRCSE